MLGCKSVVGCQLSVVGGIRRGEHKVRPEPNRRDVVGCGGIRRSRLCPAMVYRLTEQPPTMLPQF